MKTAKIFSLAAGCVFVAGTAAMAVAPADLQQRLTAGENVTLIDVRSNPFFQRGHIPGAINVPVEIIDQKPLPKIGAVVVYDGGLGETNAARALVALRAKPGITAETLDGGLAAWETAKGATTSEPGMVSGDLPRITYENLKAVAGEGDTVIVDLRSAQGMSKTASGAGPTELSAEFPGARVTKSPFGITPQKTASGRPGPAPLLVLIDSGDGKADEMARALKANGNKRFVILAGGEEMLARKGKTGLQRSGSVVTVSESQAAGMNTNR
jgi:rhodanese-related sulfurtransferase